MVEQATLIGEIGALVAGPFAPALFIVFLGVYTVNGTKTYVRRWMTGEEEIIRRSVEGVDRKARASEQSDLAAWEKIEMEDGGFWAQDEGQQEIWRKLS